MSLFYFCLDLLPLSHLTPEKCTTLPICLFSLSPRLATRLTPPVCKDLELSSHCSFPFIHIHKIYSRKGGMVLHCSPTGGSPRWSLARPPRPPTRWMGSRINSETSGETTSSWNLFSWFVYSFHKGVKKGQNSKRLASLSRGSNRGIQQMTQTAGWGSTLVSMQC